MLKVYEDLTRDELLLKCVSGRTQNPNESLHAKLWANSPKHKFFGKKRIDALAALIVSEHNMGYDNCDLMNHFWTRKRRRPHPTCRPVTEVAAKADCRTSEAVKEEVPQAVSLDMDYEPGAH